ncbi:cache domain-containing protein [Candidatus Kuenenia sp.]|uniref:cache domain-containing protein n=1 Tax=Candidatus Kuenenia sp. TaxID=2499824 RepID=UPI00321FFF63
MYRILVASSIAFFTFLVIMGPLTYRTLIPALEYEAKNHLISVREIKKMQIQNFFYERYGDVHILSKNPIVEQSLPRFSNAFKSAGLDSTPYKQVDTYYGPLLEHYQRQYGYQNILLVDKDGNVVFGVKRDEYLGTNLKTGVFSSFTIGEVYREGLNNIKFSDLTWSEDSKDFIFLGAAPVYDVSNNLLGLVVVEIPFSKIDYILLQRDGLGETGEIYVVGDDNFMRSKSRFLKQNTILKLEIDTQATKEAFAGHTDIKIIKDYRNMPVLSAYTPLENLRDINWILLVEMDKKEAFYAVLALKTNLIIIGTVIAVITIVYLYFYFRKRHLQSGHSTY